MSKFKYLITYGLKKRIGTKAFYIANAILLIASILVINLPNIAKYFGNTESDSAEIGIFDTLNLDIDSIGLLNAHQNEVNLITTISNMTFIKMDTLDTTAIEDYPYEAILVLSRSGDQLEVTLYKNNLSAIDETILVQALEHLKAEVWKVDKTAEEISLIEDYLTPLDYEIISATDSDDTLNTILGILSILLAIPIFFILMLMVQFVGVDIIEEKQSKAIEFLMSTIPPQTHFITKIIAAFLFLMVQSILILIYGTIGTLLSIGIAGSGGLSLSEVIGLMTQTNPEIILGVFNHLPIALTITFLFTFIGGLFFMILMATLASMATSMEDFQQFQTPFVLTMLAGFYMAIFSIYIPNPLLLKIMAYIPLFAPTLAPTLYLSGSFSLVEVIISLGILLVVTYLIYKLVMPIYKVSILSYDQSPFFSRIKNLFKKSKNA